jgi:hypothetical protein
MQPPIQPKPLDGHTKQPYSDADIYQYQQSEEDELV